jgi:hypothetical protein
MHPQCAALRPDALTFHRAVLSGYDGSSCSRSGFVSFRPAYPDGWSFSIVFEAGIPLRRALAARLFTGAYRNVIDEIVIPCVLYVIGKRLLR